MLEIGVKDSFVVCFLIRWSFTNLVDVVDAREGEHRYVITMFSYLRPNTTRHEPHRREILLSTLENSNKLSQLIFREVGNFGENLKVYRTFGKKKLMRY